MYNFCFSSHPVCTAVQAGNKPLVTTTNVAAFDACATLACFQVVGPPCRMIRPSPFNLGLHILPLKVAQGTPFPGCTDLI